MKQGQSDATKYKEAKFESVFNINMKILNAKLPGKVYWHLDANCGSGLNEKVGIPGSPLVFHWATDRHLSSMRVASFFCDINSAAIDELKLRIEQKYLCNSTFWNEDNERCVSEFGNIIRKYDNPVYAKGSILIDLNGWYYRNRDGQGPPVNSIKDFSREFKGIDIIINANLLSYRRMLGVRRKEMLFPGLLSPNDVLSSIHKNSWLVGKTEAAHGGEWLVAVGRNLETKEHRAQGLFHSYGEIGQKILLSEKINKKEDDLPLFASLMK